MAYQPDYAQSPYYCALNSRFYIRTAEFYTKLGYHVLAASAKAKAAYWAQLADRKAAR